MDWKIKSHFPIREKSGNFNRLEKSHKILEKSGNLKQCYLFYFSAVQMDCVLFAKMDQVFRF